TNGSAPKLLTPGNCEVEQWSFTPDKKTILYNSNCDDVDSYAIDRRHIWATDLTGAQNEQLTSGRVQIVQGFAAGIEWSPIALINGEEFFAFGSEGTHPPELRHYFLKPKKGSANPAQWPAGFPGKALVEPQRAIFKSADNYEIHGQLFLPKNLKPGEKRPALIFIHGGSMRQMLLGWHYMYYYANAYAMNQYLANRGYIVLAVNYRSGIGYGRAFREAPNRAGRGASEYQDI